LLRAEDALKIVRRHQHGWAGRHPVTADRRRFRNNGEKIAWGVLDPGSLAALIPFWGEFDYGARRVFPRRERKNYKVAIKSV